LWICIRAAPLVDKILKGTAPSDIPIERAVKFDLGARCRAASIAAGPREGGDQIKRREGPT
jgi:hypothetical protein